MAKIIRGNDYIFKGNRDPITGRTRIITFTVRNDEIHVSYGHRCDSSEDYKRMHENNEHLEEIMRESRRKLAQSEIDAMNGPTLMTSMVT